jgi:hypothetical protein
MTLQQLAINLVSNTVQQNQGIHLARDAQQADGLVVSCIPGTAFGLDLWAMALSEHASSDAEPCQTPTQPQSHDATTDP